MTAPSVACDPQMIRLGLLTVWYDSERVKPSPRPDVVCRARHRRAARADDVIRTQALCRAVARPFLGLPALAALCRARAARPGGTAHGGAGGRRAAAAYLRDHAGGPCGARRLAAHACERPGRAPRPRAAQALLRRARRWRGHAGARARAGCGPSRDARPLRVDLATLRRPAGVRAAAASPAGGVWARA